MADSSDHPSHPQVLPSFSTGSQTVPSGCASIMEASITSRSRTSTCCRWLGSRWTGSKELGGLPSLTLLVHKWKTAFLTRYGHFKYQVMPFPTSVCADMRFASEGLTWMQTTKRVELLSAKEYATAAQGTMIKAFVARSWRSRMFPSRFPPSVWMTPIFSLQTPQRHYPSTPA